MSSKIHPSKFDPFRFWASPLTFQFTCNRNHFNSAIGHTERERESEAEVVFWIFPFHFRPHWWTEWAIYIFSFSLPSASLGPWPWWSASFFLLFFRLFCQSVCPNSPQSSMRALELSLTFAHFILFSIQLFGPLKLLTPSASPSLGVKRDANDSLSLALCPIVNSVMPHTTHPLGQELQNYFSFSSLHL